MQLKKKWQNLQTKKVAVIAIHGSQIEQDKLEEFIKENEIEFPVGKIIVDEEKTRFTWGVKSLPWLILTDKQHIVIAEGFGFGELDEKIRETTEAGK
jgi:hypothetical protein